MAGRSREGRHREAGVRRVVRLLGALLAVAALLAGCRSSAPDTPTPPPSTSPPPPTAPAPATAPATWRPPPGTSWQWQLSGQVDLGVPAQVYDVDGQASPASLVTALHAAGRRAVCYVSVGTREDFRPGAGAFPPQVVGRALADFPDERWLDVRRLDLLAPPLRARFDDCRAKGFDAVEPDDVDAYANPSGFPLTAGDQLAFNRWVAAEVRSRGMAVGLKNDLDQVPELVGSFDFAVVEQCREFAECDALQPFVAAGKAVLHVEYGRTAADCGGPAPAGFSTLVKDVDLDAFRVVCP